MTCGAAASLTITLTALACEGDEVIVFTPFFPEYRVFIEATGSKIVTVESRKEDFQIDPSALENAITPNTKAVIVNSPNNPSGVVLKEETIIGICKVLEKKSAEYAHPIYLISDEPYRELVYGDVKVPYLLKYYKDCFVCYSFSKSLSLPGERIGYILVSPEMEENRDVYAAVCGAGRALGYVCAPTLFQMVIKECCDAVSDVSIYESNRNLLAGALREYGYRCIEPDGAFYLFVEAMESDANAFCETAKKYELLLVPGDDFGCKGFVRIAYCVTREQIEKSLPAFKALAEEYRSKKG
jgi:aspartate aminotransferase